MMRSPRFFAVACRKPDGEIVVSSEPVAKTISGRLKWLNKPFLRGSLALVDAMALGTRALKFSAEVQASATIAVSALLGLILPGVMNQPDGNLPIAPARKPVINDIAIGGTMALAFCSGLALFVALPTLLVQPVQHQVTHGGTIALSRLQQTELNLLDGLVRIVIFLGYIALISRLENIRRVFQYHGAEHKAINTLEAGRPLTTEQCLTASRIHPRCGTSFIIVVLIASILVHSLFPRPDNYFVRVALHLSLIPVVAGFAYEVIRLAGRFRSAVVLQALLAPGLWSQRLTTREPDASQVEVALAALNAVLEQEKATPAQAAA